MIIFRSTQIQPESVIQKLKRKSWEKSLREISDGEIISMDPDPLREKKELPEKVETNDTATSERTENQV